MPKSITLGGFPLLADQAVTWALQYGTTPVERNFSCSPDIATLILAQGGPMTLQIVHEDNTKSEFKNLWPLSPAPSANPFLAMVRVADRRWMWAYFHTLRRYNMRRRTGFFRIQANDVPELQRVEEKLAYAQYSLNGGRPWKARAIIGDVLTQISAAEKQAKGKGFNVRLTKEFRAVADISAENVELDDQSHSALARALALVPEAALYVDPEGVVVVTSRAGGGELAVRKLLLPEIVGGGHAVEVTHFNEIPKEIHVLFTIESELRFDFQEGETLDVEEKQRQLSNVLPVPDYTLDVSAGGITQTVTQSTFLEFQQYLDNIGAPPGMGIPKLSLRLIRQAFMPFMDLWAAIAEVGILDTQADWTARIAAIQQHYRRTLRLPRGWMDRIFALRAQRVATVNQATGARAPAVVYADHAILGSQRSQLRDYSRTGKLVYAKNVAGYRDVLDEAAKPAPASVSIYDADQGVIHLDYLLDPYRVYEMVLPSKIEAQGIPAWSDPKRIETNITFDSLLSAGAKKPSLSASHRAAVVLTAIPASPNDARQLWRVVVKPGDVSARLPQSINADIGKARGPAREIRVGAGIETARLRWLDERSQDYEKLFGIRQGEPDLAGLCVNGTGGATSLANFRAILGNPLAGLGARVEPNIFAANGFSAGRGASLDEIAKAIAARVWASYATHLGGAMAGDMRVGAEPNGRVESIEHSVAPNGVSTTSATFPPSRQIEFAFETILDASTRAVILRHVFQGQR